MLRSLILLVSLVAVGLALAIVAAGPGTRFGLWDYGTGLQIIRTVALPVLIAAGLSVAAFIISLIAVREVALMAFLAAVMAGTAGYVPIKMKAYFEANPIIHDITTDFDNPPPIIMGASFERKNPAEYVGDEKAPGGEATIAEAQREAFPDIMPLLLDGSIEDNAKNVRSVIAEMGMVILSDASSEDSQLIEATYTSAWFGFIDDFVVRLQADGEKTRVDVRSKSRVGTSDLGANARRVQEFFKKLQE
jgi:uncharacterized protein (DUF1499 family)